MKHRYGIIILLIFVSIFSCKPDPLEYARPENLAGTISTQLESMGTFNYYLQSLGQTQYFEPLAKGGSWTVFAPTDEAFEKFMADNGYTTFESIPEQRILDLVQNSIITDAWNTTTLTYFKSRFYLGQSFRRRTQFQEPNREVNPDTLQHIIDWNKLEPGNKIVLYSNGRLKTVNYFLDSYMDTWGVQNEDYDFMFPGETFSDGDMKVFGTNVSQQNVIAENGIIYALDEVIEPRRNLYENLTLPEYGDKYSMFRKMMERFSYLHSLGDIENPDTGDIEEVFQWRFTTGIENDNLPFNLFDENYATNIDGTLAQAWGLLVPTNEALLNYLDGNSILGQYYDSYDDMPLDVLGKFIKPNFFRDYYNIVPSSFGQSYDYGLGFVDYKPEDVVDKRFCSNGLFVGVNTVYTNDSFGTIMGPLLLDPNYYVMLKSIQDLGIDTALQSKGVRFTILGVRNDQFIDVADPNSATRRITVVDIDLDEDIIYMAVTGDPIEANNRIYPDPNTTSPSSADVTYVSNTLNAIVLNQIIDEEVDFNGSNFYQTRSGEYVEAFNGNSAAGGGDIEVGQSAQIEKSQETTNGYFYEMSSIINPPSYFTYGTLVENAASYSSFIEVLETAGVLIDIVGSTDKLISFLNLQRTFSLFAPNNSAVAKAISDGVIVEPSTVEGIVDEVEKATAINDLLNFSKKHFIQQAMSTDGKTSGTFSSMYYSKIVDFAPVYDQFITVNTTSSIQLTNEETGASVTTSGVTNLLSKRVVIHEIDNYIK
ncbi:fasciclin domain-containing protein [Algibacter mikhailovii]|uniref:fasciclin domain-containing protein n=1 Tax=Algibacter mikhailovii TaxID=425498 RepID=UPI002493FC8B|nr:fasciclin domain-containing protein [Algibacter mikhailovii]